MASEGKLYTGEEIDVRFYPERCIHAGRCVKNLPTVFDTKKRPWVEPDQAEASDVAYTVEQCPSGALEYVRKDGGLSEQPPDHTVIEVQPDGVYFVRGDLTIRHGDETIHCTRASLCSCGLSGNKPFCDLSHAKKS
ncbi:(4Fe-4S)-binding protein [Jeotgalibacillus aurantiacus]|uniref:(4Fe-4S)-binding protein n=1 Tax=Jeotgalibacillus aurantiacus TaxID=2763266 RepID=UPI001D0B4A64|nr:(4Fe-4S)-binding protein [Jeotgalibacillus aurantiacus]